jgi:N-acetylglucosamine-6-phosphate deacetylase
VIEDALRAVRDAIHARVPGVLGIHIEGPFLNPERKGAHDPAKLRTLDASAVKLLATPTGGRTMLTLAPEMTDAGTLRALANAGIILSAGHTNATHAEVKLALGHGLRGFTHLFNAMSPLGNREPGVVGAALEDAGSWCGIIVDGFHVDPVTLRLALRCKPTDRFMLVSDAMPNVGADIGEFMLAGKRIVVHDGKLLDEAGTLAGASLHMAGAVANAIKLLDVEPASAARMASRNPAAFLGLEAELGRIEPGYRANLVLADDRLDVLETWIDGVPSAGV